MIDAASRALLGPLALDDDRVAALELLAHNLVRRKDDEREAELGAGVKRRRNHHGALAGAQRAKLEHHRALRRIARRLVGRVDRKQALAPEIESASVQCQERAQRKRLESNEREIR